MAFSQGASGEQRFDVKGSLGAGGMGMVYRAFDRRLGRDVALKTLRQASGRDLYRFKREFRSLADLAHPNLVSLHELHTAGDEWFFTMEVVEGVTFINWVRPAGPASPRPPSSPGDDTGATRTTPRTRKDVVAAPPALDRLRAALPQLVEGVAVLHAAGKLHRDLKPSNVMVTADGRVVLLDFGLVAEVGGSGDDRTHEAAAVGTPAYMSPEQAADLTLTEASDWYAVGVILYEALTGRRPFEGAPEELMQRKQREVPPSPRQLAPETPEDLDRLCMRLLDPDPARRPEALAIFEALGATPSSALTTMERHVSRLFVGRARELAALRAALTDAREHAVTVFVAGESGIGKSRLVRRFLDEAGPDLTVLEGRCYERESVPYKALDTLVDAITAALLGMSATARAAMLPDDVAALARLFPVLRRVPEVGARSLTANLPAMPVELRARGFAALRALIASLAHSAPPLVIVIDDLQWGDADSAVFLSNLIHDEDAPPILVVPIHRPEDDAGVVARVRAPGADRPRGDVRDVALGPLSDDDARALVVATGLHEGSTDSLIREAAGHPLFLAELVRTTDHRAGASTFEELVAHRVAGLPAPAATLLRIAAVAARPIPPDLAERAAAITLGSELALLRAERLLRVRHLGDADVVHVEAYHDRVRAAVVASVPPSELRALHEGLARAYEASRRSEDLEPLVHHWRAAGHPARAAGYAIDAARVAEQSFAFHRAAGLYALALALGEHEPAARRQLHRAHGDALANTGQLVAAADEYAVAAEGADDDERFELDRLRLAQLLRCGLLAQGRELSRAMLEPLGIRFPHSRAQAIRALLVQRVRNRLRGLDFVERREDEVPREVLRRVDLLSSTATGLGIAEPIVGSVVQAHRLRAALDCGEPNRICTALAIELAYRGRKGTHGQRRIDEVVARIRPLGERVDRPQARAMAAVMQGFMQFECGRWKEARLMLEAGLAMMREAVTGMRWELTINEQTHVGVLVYLGEARELVRLVPRYLREASERGDTYARDAVRGWRGNVAWLFMGRPAEARAHADEVATPMPASEDVQIRHLNEMVSRLQIDLYEGKPEVAYQRALALWPILHASHLLSVQILRVEANLALGRAALAYAATAAGRDRATALDRAGRVARDLAGERAPWATAIADMLRGVIARHAGDERAALAHLDAAEHGFAASDMRLFAAAVRLRRGELEGGTPGTARASAAIAELRDQAIVDPHAIARMLCPWTR